MASRPISTITLPTERMAQLNAIAKARGLSLAELIGTFVRAEAVAGIVTDEIPGYRIEAAAGQVEFELGKIVLTVSRIEAVVMADSLEAAAGGETWAWAELRSDDRFTVRRRGRGAGRRSSAPPRRTAPLAPHHSDGVLQPILRASTRQGPRPSCPVQFADGHAASRRLVCRVILD